MRHGRPPSSWAAIRARSIPIGSAGLARTVAQHNVTINNLLPGSFDTDRLQAAFRARARKTGQPLESVQSAALQAIPAQRLGDPTEFGQVCAFICSAQASYLVGQNVLLDGGAYPGTY